MKTMCLLVLRETGAACLSSDRQTSKSQGKDFSMNVSYRCSGSKFRNEPWVEFCELIKARMRHHIAKTFASESGKSN
jgi:hypothetical protein